VLITGVAVEKLAHWEFAKIRSRQEALQTISPSFLDIFYHRIFGFFSAKPTFSTATPVRNIYLISKSGGAFIAMWRSVRIGPQASTLGAPRATCLKEDGG
jgi:hypothetical protein